MCVNVDEPDNETPASTAYISIILLSIFNAVVVVLRDTAMAVFK